MLKRHDAENHMKYSVKMLIRHSVDSGEVFLEESIIMVEADSFDDAYEKAEKYVSDNEICSSYHNIYGKRVISEVLSGMTQLSGTI